MWLAAYRIFMLLSEILCVVIGIWNHDAQNIAFAVLIHMWRTEDMQK